jgi:hypothetical protein
VEGGVVPYLGSVRKIFTREYGRTLKIKKKKIISILQPKFEALTFGLRRKFANN